ncbi:hypothetical protein HMPREF1861_00384 [Corynebacterium kroppenstedtii]|nr:hypothetical protein HMPREF1861_00384 [Corynebacterium kroppenstedtii]
MTIKATPTATKAMDVMETAMVHRADRTVVAITSTVAAMVIKAATTVAVTAKTTTVVQSAAVPGTRIRTEKTIAPINEAVTATGDTIRTALS